MPKLMPSPNLWNKFWLIVRIKLYMAGIIIALLAPDLIIVLVMACFTHALVVGINYLGAGDETAIQVILKLSGAIYVIIYLFFAVLFVSTMAKEVRDIIQSEPEKS